MTSDRPCRTIGQGQRDRPDPVGPIEQRRLHEELRARLFGRPRARVQIAGYEVLHPLGQGGMGSVYAVCRPGDERRLALKLVESSSPRAIKRLRREGRLLAALDHPYVAKVHDVGVCDEGTYVVMDCIDGTTLTDWLATPRGWRATLTCLSSAIDGLASAHRHGVLHRDLKPGNLRVDHQEHAWLLDFGLAKPLPDSVVERASTLRQPLTRPGSLMGTVGYVAPEHLLGDPLDARSDQFSMCVVLYEALFGQPPFAGESAEEVGLAVLSGKVQPPPAGHAVPSRVTALVLQGLRTEPERRHASVGALHQELATAVKKSTGAGRWSRWWRALRG
ncbi:MAG: serine/threonine-protein kinase [Myxococcota bacterium]